MHPKAELVGSSDSKWSKVHTKSHAICLLFQLGIDREHMRIFKYPVPINCVWQIIHPTDAWSRKWFTFPLDNNSTKRVYRVLQLHEKHSEPYHVLAKEKGLAFYQQDAVFKGSDCMTLILILLVLSDCSIEDWLPELLSEPTTCSSWWNLNWTLHHSLLQPPAWLYLHNSVSAAQFHINLHAVSDWIRNYSHLQQI